MGIKIEYPPGATPLDADDAAALIPKHIATQGQLNEWEQQNISEGQLWVFSKKHEDILSIDFMQVLHKKMLGDTWQWAGKIRTKETRPGVAPEIIRVEIKKLCEDVKVQIQHQTWSLDEIAARFHHRLVYIHPFPNGNGRFSRIMTDLLCMQIGCEPFSWGAGDLNAKGDVRNRYLDSLYAADAKDYSRLLGFVRSGV